MNAYTVICIHTSYVFKHKWLLLTESVSHFVIHPCLLILTTTETTQASQTFSLSYKGKLPAKHVGIRMVSKPCCYMPIIPASMQLAKGKISGATVNGLSTFLMLRIAWSYAKGPRTWLFLFNIIWLLFPEDTAVLVNEHNLCYPPRGEFCN